MREVTIGLIQLENKLCDKEYNLEKAVQLIRGAAKKGAVIICLPELFVTGYNLNVFGDDLYDMAEGIDGPTITRLCSEAKELGVYIIAPIAMTGGEGGKLKNAAVLINDEGEVQGIYNKNHLFGDECNYFSRDGEYPVFDTKYGKIGFIICADNNHPEPARILALKGAEIVFMPAAWRVQEADIWPLLIRCHALENNIFLAVCNTYSKMEDLFLFGHSMIANPRGKILEEIEEDQEGVIVYTVDLDEVATYRAIMPSLKDRHPEDYSVFCDPVQ